MLVSVKLPYACYGIIIESGRVTHAPPIAHWMIGKPEWEVYEWLKKKGAETCAVDADAVL